MTVATRSKVWVCGRLLIGIAGSKLGGTNVCLLLGFCVCCQVEISATDRSLVQRSPTLCGVSECDLDTSTMRKPTPTRAVEPRRKVCYPSPPLKNTQILSGIDLFLFYLSMKSY